MAIFRVRNLLIQVLPRECNIDSGCGDSLDCGDTAGCDLSEACGDTEGCDGDSVDCGDSCIGETEDCGDSCIEVTEDCGDSCIGDTEGCGDSCVGETCGNQTGCDNDITKGCENPETGVCQAFECSLHFRTNPCVIVGVTTICNDPSLGQVAGMTECQLPLATPICVPPTNECQKPGITGECQFPSCEILVSLPLCPNPADTKCGGASVIALRPPVGVCFRSNEPKLNPNSLAELGILRRQLVVALAIVRRRESALAKALTPKTPRQIEAAESILSSALRDLKEKKQFIQSRAMAAKAASGKTKKTGRVKGAPAKAGRKKARPGKRARKE